MPRQPRAPCSPVPSCPWPRAGGVVVRRKGCARMSACAGDLCWREWSPRITLWHHKPQGARNGTSFPLRALRDAPHSEAPKRHPQYRRDADRGPNPATCPGDARWGLAPPRLSQPRALAGGACSQRKAPSTFRSSRRHCTHSCTHISLPAAPKWPAPARRVAAWAWQLAAPHLSGLFNFASTFPSSRNMGHCAKLEHGGGCRVSRQSSPGVQVQPLNRGAHDARGGDTVPPGRGRLLDA